MVFKRLQKDKKFRKNVFIFAVLLLFITNFNAVQNQATVPQATCDQYNSFPGDRIWTTADYTSCENVGCSVEYQVDPTIYGPINNFVYWVLANLLNIQLPPIQCMSKAQVGKWVLADSQSGANIQCESNYAVLRDANFGVKDIYVCATAPEGSVCSGWQQPIAQVWDALPGLKEIDMSCTTKSYILIFLAGLALLAVI